MQLDGELEAALGLLDAIMARNPCGLIQYIPVLVDAFLPLLKSPLAFEVDCVDYDSTEATEKHRAGQSHGLIDTSKSKVHD